MEEAEVSTQVALRADAFYANYYGHPIDDLVLLHAHIRRNHAAKAEDGIVWLAGDSSFDSKHWLSSPFGKLMRSYEALSSKDIARLPRAYEGVFAHPRLAVCDVAYWVNHHLECAASPLVALNCAVEEATLRRSASALSKHDMLVRSCIRSNDVLVVSAGGNDVLLAPSVRTLLTVAVLNFLVPTFLVERDLVPSVLLGGLRAIFKDQMTQYLRALCDITLPRLVIVCMCYYPCVHADAESPSWADRFLEGVGYSRSPAHLQRLIDMMFARLTCDIAIEGTRVVPLALSTLLDCNDAADYVQRVEPSCAGGAKMAWRIAELALE